MSLLLLCVVFVSIGSALFRSLFSLTHKHTHTHHTSYGREYIGGSSIRQHFVGRPDFFLPEFSWPHSYFSVWVAPLTNPKTSLALPFSVTRRTRARARQTPDFSHTRTYTGAHSNGRTGPLKSQANDLDAHTETGSRKMVVMGACRC